MRATPRRTAGMSSAVSNDAAEALAAACAGGHIDKVEALCPAVKDRCLPVILSKKKGKDALELCPDAANHGGLDGECHKRPAGLDLDKIFNTCTRKATADELKAANWAAAGKGKRAKI